MRHKLYNSAVWTSRHWFSSCQQWSVSPRLWEHHSLTWIHLSPFQVSWCIAIQIHDQCLLKSALKMISYFTDSKQQYLSVERRQFDEPNASDDASLCFFIQEKDESSKISCKHRLTRSKFNYNPFGLRFGKRNEATTTDSDGPKHKHLLPMMFYLRKQLETSWKSLFIRWKDVVCLVENCG